MNNSEFASVIFKLVVVVLSTWISLYVVPFLSELTSKYKDARLEKFVNDSVRAAEQVVKGSGKGSIKKEKVLKAASEWLKKYHIDISEEDLDTLIESIVFTMNHPEECSK